MLYIYILINNRIIYMGNILKPIKPNWNYEKTIKNHEKKNNQNQYKPKKPCFSVFFFQFLMENLVISFFPEKKITNPESVDISKKIKISPQNIFFFLEHSYKDFNYQILKVWESLLLYVSACDILYKKCRIPFFTNKSSISKPIKILSSTVNTEIVGCLFT